MKTFPSPQLQRTAKNVVQCACIPRFCSSVWHSTAVKLWFVRYFRTAWPVNVAPHHNSVERLLKTVLCDTHAEVCRATKLLSYLQSPIDGPIPRQQHRWSTKVTGGRGLLHRTSTDRGVQVSTDHARGNSWRQRVLYRAALSYNY